MRTGPSDSGPTMMMTWLVETGKGIGRIFHNTISNLSETPWFWGLDFFVGGRRRRF